MELGEQKYKIELAENQKDPDIDINLLHGEVVFYSGLKIMTNSTDYDWKLTLHQGRNFIKLSDHTKTDGPNVEGFLPFSSLLQPIWNN